MGEKQDVLAKGDVCRKDEAEPTALARARLHFLWSWVWISLATIPFSVAQCIGHQFRPTAQHFSWWASRWGRTVLGGMGMRVEAAERAPLDPEQPYVFVANHQNAIDIMALAGGLPYPFVFLAKEELKQVPFLSLALRNSACIFIDRSSPRRSIESLRAAGRRIRAGESVLVFPEGGRSYAARLAPFKRGAFLVAIEAGVPLVPVTVLDSYRLMDERAYAARGGTVRLVLGRPVPTDGARRRDVPGLIQKVRAQMEAELREAEAQQAGRAPAG